MLTGLEKIFSRPGQSQGLLYKHICHTLTDALTDSFTHPLFKIYLRRRNALMVEDSAFSHKIDYVF